MTLTCPKCQGEMRHYERSGVVVDQCAECRGIFLDRGELERLVDAESQWNQRSAAPAAAPQPPAQPQPSYQPAAVVPAAAVVRARLRRALPRWLRQA